MLSHVIPLVLISLITGGPGNAVPPSINDHDAGQEHALLFAQDVAQRVQYLIDFIAIIVMHRADANGAPAIVDVE